MNDLKISKKIRTYIPEKLNVDWASLEPIFNELQGRNINSVSELEKWLLDRSELDAAGES